MGSQARLRIIQITDVYTLSNFPSLKTLIQEKRAEVEGSIGSIDWDPGAKTIRVAIQ